ncbi:MAG: pyridoxamine 5'-phosphate oxidase family protein [Blastocatellia bacterium]
MATTRSSAKQKQSVQTSGPLVSRPVMPKDYGIPKDKKGLLPWSHVTERMQAAKVYWVCTVSPDGHPHATPVDGVWVDDRLYFGGSPRTRRHRNLAANPAACIHLESGSDVVILHGEARELHAPARTLTTRLAAASKEKYGYAFTPEQYETMPGVLEFSPRLVLAWKEFPKDVTRFQFRPDKGSKQ